jgi:GT2 family glycosyltransferase
MKIGFVCTNFNNARFTREAVRSLLACRGHEISIAIVDNDSDAADIRMLGEIALEFPAIHIIYNKNNVGYFGGLNIGIRFLRASHPETRHLVVGNNDLEFSSDFVSSIDANCGLLQKYPVLSPDVITVDGVHQNPHVITRITRLREMAYDLYYSNYYVAWMMLKMSKWGRNFTERGDERQWQRAQRIYQGHGSCYILGPLFFERFAELWAPTFMMGEEYFLSKQLSDIGMSIFYEPAIQVVHHYHATVASVPPKKSWGMARDAHRVYRRYVGIM